MCMIDTLSQSATTVTVAAIVVPEVRKGLLRPSYWEEGPHYAVGQYYGVRCPITGRQGAVHESQVRAPGPIRGDEVRWFA